MPCRHDASVSLEVEKWLCRLFVYKMVVRKSLAVAVPGTGRYMLLWNARSLAKVGLAIGALNSARDDGKSSANLDLRESLRAPSVSLNFPSVVINDSYLEHLIA